MRPLKLDRILAAEASLQPVLAKAHELRTLAGLLEGFLPADFARQTRVVDYRDGVAANGFDVAGVFLDEVLKRAGLVGVVEIEWFCGCGG